MDSIEEKTAYHEAGHAVAAVLLGGRVHRVSIEPDCDEGPNRYGETITVWPRMTVAKICSAEICVALAGPVAEMLFTDEKIPVQSVPEWRADWLQIANLTAELLGYLGETTTAASIVESSQQRVTELFDDPNIWSAVASLADELLTHYTLEAEQVDEVVGFWSRQ